MRALYASVSGVFIGLMLAFSPSPVFTDALPFMTLDGTIETYDPVSRTLVMRSDLFAESLRMELAPDTLQYRNAYVSDGIAIAQMIHEDDSRLVPGTRVSALSAKMVGERLVTSAIIVSVIDPL